MSVNRLVNFDRIRIPDGLNPALQALLEELLGNVQREVDYIEGFLSESDTLTTEAEGVTVSVSGGGSSTPSTLQIEVKRNVLINEGENIISYDTDFSDVPALTIITRSMTNEQTRENQLYDEAAKNFKVYVGEPCRLTYIAIRT